MSIGSVLARAAAKEVIRPPSAAVGTMTSVDKVLANIKDAAKKVRLLSMYITKPRHPIERYTSEMASSQLPMLTSATSATMGYIATVYVTVKHLSPQVVLSSHTLLPISMLADGLVRRFYPVSSVELAITMELLPMHGA